MEVKVDFKLRKKVVNYLNKDRRRRSVNEGLSLLKETGYKPNLLKNFLKNKSRRDIPTKLDRELRMYLRYYVNPKMVDLTDDKDPDIEDENIEKVKEEIKIAENTDEYPKEVKKVIEEYSDLYKHRSILHKQLKEVGETNSNENVEKRKEINLHIKNTSHRLETLWKSFLEFKKSGKIPGPEITKEPFDPDAKIDEKETQKLDIELADNLEGLKRQNENWRIKIHRAENRLKYQSSKKLDKKNPMPEGPKRLKVEKRLERLKAEKLAIEYALAEKK